MSKASEQERHIDLNRTWMVYMLPLASLQEQEVIRVLANALRSQLNALRSQL